MLYYVDPKTEEQRPENRDRRAVCPVHLFSLAYVVHRIEVVSLFGPKPKPGPGHEVVIRIRHTKQKTEEEKTRRRRRRKNNPKTRNEEQQQKKKKTLKTCSVSAYQAAYIAVAMFV